MRGPQPDQPMGTAMAMDDWLVCFSEKLPGEVRETIVRDTGAQIRLDGETVPLGDEVALRVRADKAMVELLRTRAEVLGIYPDSRPTPY